MPRHAAKLASSFVSHLRYLEQTRSKMERLASTGYIVRRDIEQVYLGLFIDAMTSFESLIEKLFVGILVGKIKPRTKRIVPRISFESNRIAREVVLGGRNYVDWFPYEEQTEKRARAFFRNGLPFTCFSDPEKAQLRNLNYIRNAIAHQSNFSKRQFERKVIASLYLTIQEKTPAGFLRSKIRITPDQTRYENFVIQMATLANKLCS